MCREAYKFESCREHVGTVFSNQVGECCFLNFGGNRMEKYFATLKKSKEYNEKNIILSEIKPANIDGMTTVIYILTEEPDKNQPLIQVRQVPSYTLKALGKDMDQKRGFLSVYDFYSQRLHKSGIDTWILGYGFRLHNPSLFSNVSECFLFLKQNDQFFQLILPTIAWNEWPHLNILNYYLYMEEKDSFLEFDTDLCDIYNFIEPEEVFEYKLTHSTLRLNQYTIVFCSDYENGTIDSGLILPGEKFDKKLRE